MTSSVYLRDVDVTASPKVRAQTNDEVVSQYAANYRNKTPMPPIVVFQEKGSARLILADGMHRMYAVAEAGGEKIEAEIIEGDYNAALKFALMANTRHGLPRSNADKRRCISEALKQWPEMSDSAISERCGVDNHTVADVRSEMEKSKEIEAVEVKTGKDGRKVSTKSSGKSQAGAFKDHHGTTIPEGVIKYWNRAEEPKRIVETITEIMRELRKAIDEKDVMYGELAVVSVMADLEKARSAVGSSIPFAVCTQCQGHPETQAGGCRLCRGRGLISKFAWDRLVPDEVKAIRMGKK